MSTKTLIIIAVVLLILGIAMYFIFFGKKGASTVVGAPAGSGGSATQVVTTSPVPSGNLNSSTSNPPNQNINTMPGSNTLPPGASSTPPPAIKVGNSVRASAVVGMYNGAGLVTKYTAGGTDDDGNIGANQFVGVVKEINALHKSARVQNYTTPAKIYNIFSANQTVYEFWVPLNSLKL